MLYGVPLVYIIVYGTNSHYKKWRNMLNLPGTGLIPASLVRAMIIIQSLHYKVINTLLIMEDFNNFYSVIW